MEKKVKLINSQGKEIRVMEHMVEDAIARFGCTKTKKEIKNVPQELLKLPDMKKVDPLPPMEVKKERKALVRSRATK